MQTTKINVREIRTRDYLMVRVITGATKAGIQTDRRKEEDRKKCRRWKRGGRTDE